MKYSIKYQYSLWSPLETPIFLVQWNDTQRFFDEWTCYYRAGEWKGGDDKACKIGMASEKSAIDLPEVVIPV